MTFLAFSCERFNLVIHAYCQMDNHYHLMVETPDGNLGRAMKHLNGRYSSYFNKVHARPGHLFQGRYKAILVERENYLLELARYVVLNPVRAGLAEHPRDWFWSSYHATVQPDIAPAWLNTDWLLTQFAETVEAAIPAYKRFVLNGVGAASPLLDVKHQMILGDAAFAKQHGDRLDPGQLRAYPREQRRIAALSLKDYRERYPDRNDAMERAYRSTHFTMSEIGRHFGVSVKTVERAVRKVRGGP